MDNGILVFIIIALGMVVVWQTSKLKQYERFEKMLPDRSVAPPAPAAAEQPSATATGTTTGSAEAGAADRQVPAEAAARTVAELANAQAAVRTATGTGAPASGRPDAGDNIEEAKRVQLVMARCRYAEFYVDQLDDDYEREQFTRIVEDCADIADSIDDPFLQATALQPLILLMHRAGWNERQAELMGNVRDDLVRRRIEAEVAREEAAEA